MKDNISLTKNNCNVNDCDCDFVSVCVLHACMCKKGVWCYRGHELKELQNSNITLCLCGCQRIQIYNPRKGVMFEPH